MNKIYIWAVVGLLVLGIVVSETGNKDKELLKVQNSQTVDQYPTTKPNSTTDPTVLTGTVKQFYSNISSRQFAQAWGLLSRNFQKNSQDYSSFVKGYATTKLILIQDTHIQDLLTNTVFIKLQSTDNINNQIQTKNYSGTWTLIFEDGSWKLEAAEIALLNVFTSPAPNQKVFTNPQFNYSAPYAGGLEFNGYPCTDDCSGHEAGYEWAEENGIDNTDDCDGNSDSFIEGCQSFVEDNYPSEDCEDDDCEE